MDLSALVLPAALIRDLSFVVYGGGIAVFALQASLSPLVGGLPRHTVLRAYRGFGPGLGIALGLTVFSALVAHYGAVGAFSWRPVPATGGVAGLLGWLGFFALWVSNIRLEVWTLEPIRKLDPNGQGEAPDAAALDRAERAVTRHLLIQALLVALVVIFARLAVS